MSGHIAVCCLIASDSEERWCRRPARRRDGRDHHTTQERARCPYHPATCPYHPGWPCRLETAKCPACRCCSSSKALRLRGASHTRANPGWRGGCRATGCQVPAGDCHARRRAFVAQGVPPLMRTPGRGKMMIFELGRTPDRGAVRPGRSTRPGGVNRPAGGPAGLIDPVDWALGTGNCPPCLLRWHNRLAARHRQPPPARRRPESGVDPLRSVERPVVTPTAGAPATRFLGEP